MVGRDKMVRENFRTPRCSAQRTWDFFRCKKSLIQLLICVNVVSVGRAQILYSNNFNSASALSAFTIGQIGSAQVLLDSGQLRINPGPTYLNRGYAALNTSATVPGYNTILSLNSATVVWAFNVSNQDGSFNNLFRFGIYSSADGQSSTAFGYEFGAGGYVGDSMYLYRIASATSPYGPVYDEMANPLNGLSVLPQIGAAKITFTPNTGVWNLYFEQHTFTVDPLSINTLVASCVNTGFTSVSLPYVYFYSQETGSAFVDNFSIVLIPEPTTWVLLAFGMVTLLGSRRLHRCSL